MTCIAGIAQSGKVFLGGDSAGVNAHEELQLRRDTKVFVCGQFVIGVAGSWRVMQALRFAEFPSGPTTDPFKHMVKSFLPATQRLLTGIDDDFEALVGFSGRLFHVYGTRQVSEEIVDYEACGSGAQVARGSLYSTDHEPHISPAVRIKLALQASERFCSGVRAPFHILSV